MRVIKKYPNRRLYDTEKSAYITVADVLKIIRAGEDFQVVDAESGKDITRSVLVQIITEQEAGASPIFTTDMLTRFIRFYDDQSQEIFGEFLDKNLKMFAEQQKRFQDQMGNIIGSPLQIMQDLTERNLTLWNDMQAQFMRMAMGGKTDGKKEPGGEESSRKKPSKK
ncbi:MAG: polyhydroxyalkanoate synthesis repressor PhaR [Alphaproteobacteria bacterium]|nr:polyhydroxyalkanoate synthesis repressor PhaR [Alphaproteobacteria bacterium]